MTRFDWYEARGMCECGVKLDVHPPLPKPPPLRSWHSTRGLDLSVSAAASLSLTPAQRRGNRVGKGH